MRRLKIAVIGVGALGRHHARILSELPHVDLVAVSDSRTEQGQSVAAQCQTQWLPDYRELLNRDVIDAVSVVVPTMAHREVAGAFLEIGIPVLVEKPLAANVIHARELVELAANRKCLLQVGHIERFNPAFQVARSIIGEPKYIRSERTSGYTFRSTDIGVVHDLMIHDIDLILSITSCRLQSVEAFGLSVMGGHEDIANARLRFENGCIADLIASRVSPVAIRSLQTWATSGCVVCDMQNRDVRRFSPSNELISGPSPLELARQPGATLEQLKKDVFGRFVTVDSITVPPNESDALTQELVEFVECISSNSVPQVSGEQALAAMDVADRILKQVGSHNWNGTELQDNTVPPVGLRPAA